MIPLSENQIGDARQLSADSHCLSMGDEMRKVKTAIFEVADASASIWILGTVAADELLMALQPTDNATSDDRYDNATAKQAAKDNRSGQPATIATTRRTVNTLVIAVICHGRMRRKVKDSRAKPSLIQTIG